MVDIGGYAPEDDLDCAVPNGVEAFVGRAGASVLFSRFGTSEAAAVVSLDFALKENVLGEAPKDNAPGAGAVAPKLRPAPKGLEEFVPKGEGMGAAPNSEPEVEGAPDDRAEDGVPNGDVPPNGFEDVAPNILEDVEPNGLGDCPNPNGDLVAKFDAGVDSLVTSFPSLISPQRSTTTVSSGNCFAFVVRALICSTISIPSTTSPNTTCFPSRFGRVFEVKKN